MALGPVEYVVIRFPGNRFSGEIAPAIGDLVERGTVHILDLVFIKKDADGTVGWFEFDELEEGALFVEIEGESDGIVGHDDIAAIAGDLEPDSSALFILWEDLWAADLARAVLDAGGELVAGARIPHAVVEAVLAELG